MGKQFKLTMLKPKLPLNMLLLGYAFLTKQIRVTVVRQETVIYFFGLIIR